MSPAHRLPILRMRGGEWLEAVDDVAEEAPVALEYNGVSHTVMMATPSDLEQFALGFSLSEGVIESARDLYELEAESSEQGITLHMRIAGDAFVKLKERRRNMAGRTGCGLCGTESLDQVIRPLQRLAGPFLLPSAAIRLAATGLKRFQPLNQLTGATHAAAWCGPDGEICAAFEDVGRHNALDKLIGAMAMDEVDARQGFALMTSRASVELVQKAAAVGISALVAISAPTALAVRTAQECGMTLVAFARGDEFVAYANGHHIVH